MGLVLLAFVASIRHGLALGLSLHRLDTSADLDSLPDVSALLDFEPPLMQKAVWRELSIPGRIIEICGSVGGQRAFLREPSRHWRIIETGQIVMGAAPAMKPMYRRAYKVLLLQLHSHVAASPLHARQPSRSPAMAAAPPRAMLLFLYSLRLICRTIRLARRSPDLPSYWPSPCATRTRSRVGHILGDLPPYPT